METKGLADPSPELLSLFGIVPVAGGVILSGQQALRIPAVSAAIRLISEAVASLDVAVKEIGADGVATDAPNHPALLLLRDEANGWTSGFEFIRDLVIDALTDDRGGLAWVNRVNGEVREIVRYRSGVISVDYDEATGEPRYRINNRPVDAQSIIHLRATAHSTRARAATRSTARRQRRWPWPVAPQMREVLPSMPRGSPMT